MSPLDLVRRHRPEAPAPEPSAPPATLSERVVARTAGILSGRSSRRRFLARTAVVGSALAVNPLTYILKPGTAYGAVCGSCGDGWTAFCCTVNGGKNSCPPASFVAGWWKADNAAYCCGGARYIIDCNATCPTQCNCRCSGAACDGRRTCCNQFRYGQCNQQISCYGPVVCRVAICITPWAYDAACSTRTLTDNATSQHGANCLSDECNTPITRKYYALDGPDGILGIRQTVEANTPDGRGRYAVYQGGRIYYSSATGAWEIHGSIYDVWARDGGTSGAFGFPKTDVRTSADGRSRYSLFQKGGIYRWSQGTFAVPDPYHVVYNQYGGGSANGSLGLPTSPIRRSGDGRSLYLNFERGRIYRRGPLTVEIHGAIFDKHEALQGVNGPLGHVQTSVGALPDGRGRASIFEHGGVIYYTAQTGAHAVWGPLLDAYVDYGGPTSDAGYPTSDRAAVGDGRGTTFRTENAAVWETSTTGAHVVPALILTQYEQQGGPTGSLGYPTGDVERLAGGTLRQQFENGTLTATTPYPAFVKAVYQDFLDRQPTTSELDERATALERGSLTRPALVRVLAGSVEYVTTLVEKLYVDTLGRPGDASGTKFWVNEIRTGRRSVADVATKFYASPEYYDGIGGGTDESWVRDLYQKLLGRTASQSDADFWVGETQAKGRTNVAYRLYQSPESRRTRVEALYQALLGRTADPSGRDYWAGRILREGDLALAMTLASMQEYLDRAQVRYPPPG